MANQLSVHAAFIAAAQCMMEAVIRLAILLAVAVILWMIWRSVKGAIAQWREGPDLAESARAHVSVPERLLDASDMKWQLTVRQAGDKVSIAVEHPLEGRWHEWDVNARAPYADEMITSNMSAARALRDHLNAKDES